MMCISRTDSARRSNTRRRACETGFTLIELLVVIGIMVILIGIMVPALAAARRNASAAQCLSNLKQLGAATILYENDNRGFLPFAWIDNPDPRMNNFCPLLQAYLSPLPFGYYGFETGVFACPDRMPQPLIGGNPFRVSYGMNAYNAVSFPSPLTRRVTTVQQPAQTLLAADVSYAYNHPPVTTCDPGQLGYRHNGRANILLMDGHSDAYLASLATAPTNGVVVGF